MSTIELVGLKEAADIVGMSRQGIYRAVQRGELAPVARLGKRRTLVFDSRDIAVFASSRAGDSNA